MGGGSLKSIVLNRKQIPKWNKRIAQQLLTDNSKETFVADRDLFRRVYEKQHHHCGNTHDLQTINKPHCGPGHRDP